MSFQTFRTAEIETVLNRTNFSGSSPYEQIIGFSRAIRLGNFVYVSGTGPVGADEAPPAEQMRAVIALIDKALRGAGSSLEQVYRTRMYIADAKDWEVIGKVHGEFFGKIRPASTMVVAALLNPSWKVEVEVEAVVQGT